MSSSVHVLAVRYLPLLAIDVVEGNPRLTFDDLELADLAESIKEHGVFQPIVVTPTGNSLRFRLIAGERRYRASILAGEDTIPAVIAEGDEEALRSVQLDENILRVQLNPWEEALAFAHLWETQKLSLSALARRVKRSLDYVRARLALLQLTESVRAQVSGGLLSLGAAGELCKIAPDQGQEHLAQQAVEQRLTVAQTAQLVRDHRLSMRRRERKEALREKRDGLVRHFLPVVPAVVTSETFDDAKHHLSRWLTFPECGPCPTKGVFVSDACVGEDCCLDPQCYFSLALREREAEKKREQARTVERYTAFLRVTEGSELSEAHLRYILWAMLRSLFSDTDPWRVNVGLPPWHGGENGTRDWELIADWPMDRLLGGVLQLAVDYLVHRTNSFLPLALKQSLREDFGVPADVLDLPAGFTEGPKEEVLL